jgi:hypothetical protein
MFLFLILAAALAFMSLPAVGQVNPEAAPGPSQGEPTFKYQGYAGFAYTSLNQVNQSRYGLIGVKLMMTRDWGKYFGLMGAIDYNKPPLSNSSSPNPGDPSVYTVLIGPELHATLYEKLSGLFFAELGGEHTGGESMTPSLSFAGGFGGGMQYDLSNRFSIRAVGDRVGASFSLIGNSLPGSQTPQELGYSTHRTWNARGGIGVVYHF